MFDISFLILAQLLDGFSTPIIYLVRGHRDLQLCSYFVDIRHSSYVYKVLEFWSNFKKREFTISTNQLIILRYGKFDIQLYTVNREEFKWLNSFIHRFTILSRVDSWWFHVFRPEFREFNLSNLFFMIFWKYLCGDIIDI